MNLGRIARASGLGAALCAAIQGASAGSGAAEGAYPAVTPNAAPEARALLKFIQGLAGTHTLTGQHNYPNTLDASTRDAARACGKTPAVFGQDFGFSPPGDIDAVAARPRNMALVVEEYRKGAIVTLCWHAVRPTDDEPVTFDDSVQAKLTDRQWDDLITPGTKLHARWCAQVDVIAGYLKQLRDARVPVLWRPYHEMNGDWFWWGGRPGPGGSVAVYRQLFERLVRFHGINNLIWVWNVDRPTSPQRQFADYFPGADCFDVASLDVYDSDFRQSYYDGLLRLAAGKPIALAEVGPAPTLAVLERQPRWAWWMIWAEMVGEGGANANQALRALVADPRSWSLGDAAYVGASAPVRAASGFRAPP